MLCAKNGPELANWPPSPLFSQSLLNRSSLFLSLVRLVSPSIDTPSTPPTLVRSLFLAAGRHIPLQPPRPHPHPPRHSFFVASKAFFDRCENLNDCGLNRLRLLPISCTCRLVRICEAYRASSVIDYNYIDFPGPRRRASLKHASPSRCRSGDEALPGSTGGHSVSPAATARAY